MSSLLCDNQKLIQQSSLQSVISVYRLPLLDELDVLRLLPDELLRPLLDDTEPLLTDEDDPKEELPDLPDEDLTDDDPELNTLLEEELERLTIDLDELLAPDLFIIDRPLDRLTFPVLEDLL